MSITMYPNMRHQDDTFLVPLYRQFVGEIARMHMSSRNAEALIVAIETDSVDIEQVKSCFLGFPYRPFLDSCTSESPSCSLSGPQKLTTTLNNANGQWESWLGGERMYPSGVSLSENRTGASL